jgi:hypothetical protein
MDRQALRALIVPGPEFGAMTKAQQQEASAKLGQAIIAAIEADDRQLDAWESQCLSAAIGYIEMGFYTAAYVDVEMALVEPESRAADWAERLAHDVPPLAVFRQAYDLLPYRPIPKR